jgi:hypothetical protein
MQKLALSIAVALIAVTVFAIVGGNASSWRSWRRSRMRTFVVLLAFLLALPVWGQFSYPAASSTSLIFPHLTDGGTSDQRWKVTITFSNPNVTAVATIQVKFYDDNGAPLALDFGQGASATLNLTVPVGGTKSLTSTGATPATGWGIASSSVPVTGIVLFQASRLTGGTYVPYWDVAALGGGSTYFYTSYAVPDLGVALANPNASGITVQMAIRNADGTSAGSWEFPLPALGHTVFNLNDPKYGLNRATFTGTITFTPVGDPPVPFAAWTLNFREGLLTPLPPGEMHFPAPLERRVLDALSMVQEGASVLVRSLGSALYNAPPETIVEYVRQKEIVIENNGLLAARYQTSDDSVRVSRIMVETMGGSDAALAFLIGHYVARGVLQVTGLPPSGIAATGSAQTASDALSLAGMLAAGYDPGGMADFFGRLLTATGMVSFDQGTLNEFGGSMDQILNRHNAAWTNLLQACGNTPALGTICQKAHDYWHPHYPSNIP